MLRSSALRAASRKAVLVAGVRTPFVKSFGELMKVDTIGLSVAAVGGLLRQTKLDPKLIDHLVWGNVVMQTNAPNVGREIIIDLNLPKHIAANSVSMACASGLTATLQGLMMIEAGHADVVVVGGSDSISNSELPIPRKLAYGLAKMTYSKGNKVGAFFKEAGSNPLQWMPQPPSIAERSTGKTMGWHGDVIAELNSILRKDQETFAVNSHKNASIARKKGYFDQEVVPVEYTKGKKTVSYATDNLIREDWDKMPEKMPTLKPAFRKPMGTITAATSSPLTDGASAMLLMSEEKAKELKFPADVSIKAWNLSAIDPYPNLLLAPVLGWEKCLKKAQMTVKDIDLFEIHEAFAAQVLATIKCLQSPTFAQAYLQRSEPIANADIPLDKVNINGGSIAIGHPFAATGCRVLTAAMNELRRSKKRHALCSICAAGGLGGVCIVEHKP